MPVGPGLAGGGELRISLVAPDVLAEWAYVGEAE
jgi:hypothetical protein